jgi:hypothetical protein
MKLITSKHRYHRGLRFDVWTSSSSWFWRLDGPGRNSGTIGAAADEAEAVREACAMIEEMTGAGRPAPFSSLDQSLVMASSPCGRTA